MFLKYFQLPCRTGPQTTHSRVNEEQIKVCLIQISRYRFSLVIAGLTKILQKINEMVSISVHCSSIYSRGCARTRVTSSPNSTRAFKKKSSNKQIYFFGDQDQTIVTNFFRLPSCLCKSNKIYLPWLSLRSLTKFNARFSGLYHLLFSSLLTQNCVYSWLALQWFCFVKWTIWFSVDFFVLL